MRSFIKKTFVFWVLTVAVLLSFAWQSLHWVRREYYWYDSFFHALTQTNVTSCRLFQVWVAPFPPSRPVSNIGGNKENYMSWVESVEKLCQSAQRYQHSVHFEYQIFVDRKVYEKHADLVKKWAAAFPSQIHWILIEDLAFEDVPSIQSGLAQCYSGVASVCSDFLRFSQISLQGFQRDIYMDIDLLVEAYKNRHNIASQDALGARGSTPGIYHTFVSTGHNISYNCDLLIANRLPESQRLDLYADMKGVLEEYTPLYLYMSQLEQRRSSPSLEEYLQTHQPIIAWSKKNPRSTINQYGLILEGIGPGFWQTQLQKGASIPYRYGFTEGFKNYFSWRDHKAYLPYRYQTYQVLSIRFGEEMADHMISLNLALYDYLAFSKDPSHPLLAPLRAYCLEQWDQLHDLCPSPYLYCEQKIALMIESMRIGAV